MRTLLRSLVAFALVSVSGSLAAQVSVSGGANYTTIQAAITAANNGDTVTVSKGTYHENVVITGKSIFLTSSTGSPFDVTINGSTGPAITITGAAASQTIVAGIGITQSGAAQSAGGPHGGIYISSSSPTLSNLYISSALCEGVLISQGNPTISHSTILQTAVTGCTAEEGLGSAISVQGTGPSSTSLLIIDHNTLSNNKASVAYTSDKGGGGAINIAGQTQVTISNNLIYGNVSTGYGGAIYIATTPQMTLNNNIVYGNKGLSGGLDIVVPGSSVGAPVGFLSNNTIAFNTATSSNAGSDIYIGGNLAQYELVNNIIYGNAAGQYAVNCGVTYAGQTITPLVLDHNDIYSDPTTTNQPVGGSCSNPKGTYGNISADPLFTDGSASNILNGTATLQLQQGSPAIDTGNDSVAPSTLTDILGNDRFYDGTGQGYAVIDMGPYEYGSSDTGALPVNYQLTITPLSYTPSAGSTLALDATFQPLGATGFGLAGGTVTFYEDGVSIGTTTILTTGNGKTTTYYAPFTVTNITTGLHTFYATYAATQGYATDTSVFIYVLVTTPKLQNTTTALTYTPSAPTVSDTVTLTAQVGTTSGTIPAGTVYFIDGSTALGNSSLNTTTGTASYSNTFSYGSHSLTAAFVPTDTTSYNGSTGSATMNVTAAVAVATLSANPSSVNYGSAFTLTATVKTSSGANGPTGSVSFYSDGTQLGNAAITAATGTALYSATGLSGGNHTLTCTYSGDATYAPVSCSPSVTVTVVPGTSTTTLTPSLSPAQALAAFAVTAKVVDGSANAISGATVTLHQSGVSDQVGTTNSSGIATFTVSGPVSSISLQAVASANTNYTTSSANLLVPILANATTGTLIVAPTTAYEGDTVSAVVSILNTSSSVTAAGSVSLYDGTTLLSTLQLPASVTGQSLTSVTFSINTLVAGSHTLNAVYTPTANFLANTITGSTITINPSSFTLTADPSITIQTEHHKSLNISVASIGNFGGNITFSFLGALPQVLTPTFGRNPLSLPSNGSASTTVSLETDAIPGFYALLPFALLPLALRKRNRKLILVAIFTLATMVPLSGCSGHYPDHTPPGTYDLALQATGTSPSGRTVTQVAHITLIVTP